ncbi:GNAT family N-acetyltransferase [Pontibacter actiniarum]|uniref:N-acetyltransferase domain-containing protein n=1 Tax=Pontibacter actiniarum TaxID=323450 RepID=A0A1X9YTS1_9BACT|nr:GNAT family N-acetyltransferase [Pontibacter actiniarum]ARS36248.1 hypothetical protein CA264_12830 [Pontibacter actiniarum]
MQLPEGFTNETAVALERNDAETVRLLVGDDVLLKINDEQYSSCWDSLYQACPWATVYQSIAFVSAWYEIYATTYQPILVEQVRAGKLVGVFALAQDTKGHIIGAGDSQAEYQVWLATTHDSTSFLQAALLELYRLFPKSSIRLKYLPYNTPLQGLMATHFWKKHCLLKAYSQPLMVVNDESLSLELKKKNKREKLNRLKRLGHLTFEQITDSAVFQGLLDELATQYDFRKGATVNLTPFKDDTLKKRFIMTLFERKLLHVSVLKLNDAVIASNAGAAGRGWLHLQGFNTHSPIHAKYSPGILQFLMLGKHLVNSEIKVFDLTPGGDAYKENLATDLVEAHILYVGTAYSRWRKRLKDGCSTYLKSRLTKAGIQQSTLKLIKKQAQLFQEKIRLLRKRDPSALLHSLFPRARHAKSSQTYFIAFTAPDLLPPSLLAVERDSLEALLSFEAAGGWQTRWEFLGEAMRRLEAGEHCYTWRREGRLLCCAWLSPAPGQAGATLRGIYCHPGGRAGLSSFLRTAAGQVAREEGHGQVLAVAEGTATRRALEAAGFEKV